MTGHTACKPHKSPGTRHAVNSAAVGLLLTWLLLLLLNLLTGVVETTVLPASHTSHQTSLRINSEAVGLCRACDPFGEC